MALTEVLGALEIVNVMTTIMSCIAIFAKHRLQTLPKSCCYCSP